MINWFLHPRIWLTRKLITVRFLTVVCLFLAPIFGSAADFTLTMKLPTQNRNTCSSALSPGPKTPLTNSQWLLGPYTSQIGSYWAKYIRLDGLNRRGHIWEGLEERLIPKSISWAPPQEIASEKSMEIVNSILGSWQKHRGYTPAQLHRLRDIEAHLDHRRIAYFYVTNGVQVAGVRMFDSSTLPMYHSQKNRDLEEENVKLPMEIKDPKLKLPKDQYREELGLLNVDRKIYGGLESLLRAVATYLDSKYNHSDYYQFRETDFIDKHNPMIYISTRENTARLFERFAYFTRLKKYDTSGNPVGVLMTEGLVVMRVSVRDFISMHIGGRFLPRLKTDDETWDQEAHEVFDKERMLKRTHFRDSDRGYTRQMMVNQDRAAKEREQRHIERKQAEAESKYFFEKSMADQYNNRPYSFAVSMGSGPFKFTTRVSGTVSEANKNSFGTKLHTLPTPEIPEHMKPKLPLPKAPSLRERIKAAHELGEELFVD